MGAIVALTVVGTVAAGVRWGLRPLDELSRRLGGVDGATISTRFEDGGVPTELRPIYLELNRMLERVERMIERERCFADAAAHELRTPLAELRSTAEVAVRWPDAERSLAAPCEALAIGGEMERLVASLLLISRGAAGAVAARVVDTPLAPIVERCLRRTADPIDAKRLQLSVAVDGRTLAASEDAAEIIIRNLIDNAVQYTPAGGGIAITGAGLDGATSLVVENDTEGLTAEDVPRLFEPFCGTEQSHSDREHAGLGLAVVQQMARAAGLTVEAELRGRRLRMKVTQEIG